MKVADNQYLYRLETQNENGASIDYIDVETVEPLRSVQDIHDEIDLENNKQIKRIEEIVFTGDSDEYWYNDDTHTTDTHFVAYIEGTNLFCNVDHPYCETDRAVFEFGDVHIDENKNFFCTSVELNGMNRIYISIDKSLLAYTVYSHETLKEYFKENPVTVWYVLRYPVEIPRIHAKGHVITHHGSTTIDVQPQTMGKVTPVVKATIEDSVIEMDSVPTMTINNTDEGNQITDLTFEGVTIVNNAKGDNVKGTKEVSHTRYDFAPFYDGQTTINNTIEGGYVSAKLYGDTMINIAKTYGETDLLTATEDGAIVDLLGENTDGVKLADGTLTEGRLYGDTICNLIDFNKKSNGGGCYINYNSETKKFEIEVVKANQGIQCVVPIVTAKIKPSTKYWMKLKIRLPKEDSSKKMGHMWRNLSGAATYGGYSEMECKSQEIIKTVTTTAYTTTHDSVGIWISIPIGFNIGDIITIEAVLLEYSEEIEQLNLSYFDSIGSTTNPTITFTTHPFIFGKGGRL